MAEEFVPQLLIDGRLAAARSGKTFANIDPFNETEIGQTPDAGIEDVDAAATAAQRAFESTRWSKDHAFRARCLGQLREAMLRHLEGLREILVSEVGCPTFMTNYFQLNDPVDEITDWMELAESYAFERNLPPHPAMLSPNDRLLIKEPWGVTALITPYNYPIQQLIYKLGPALAAGNGVPPERWTSR